MISKITISNFGIFKGQEWQVVKKLPSPSNVEPGKHDKLVYLYGQNYAGKTTLSRIIRSIEEKELPDKIENPDFSVQLWSGVEIKPGNLQESNLEVRVFNRDFVREHLGFVYDDEGDISPFAVLGESNQEVEAEILKLQNELGVVEEGGESTGKRRLLQEKSEAYHRVGTDLSNKRNTLDSQLKYKALDREAGIKYNPARFGDQNYSTSKIKREISQVLKKGYSPPAEARIKELNLLLEERAKDDQAEANPPAMKLAHLASSCQNLLEKKVGSGEKIEDLVRDSILNNWVKKGVEIHEHSKDGCKFCGNPISEDRWAKLEQHFDEESRALETEIQKVLVEISQEINWWETIKKGFEKGGFYQELQVQFESLNQKLSELCFPYLKALAALKDQLQVRADNLYQEAQFSPVSLDHEAIPKIWDEYNEIVRSHNKLTQTLNSRKEKAQKELRLFEVYQFAKQIKYTDQTQKINQLSDEVRNKKSEKEVVEKEIEALEIRINQKRNELKDESRGAEKVNEFLTGYFGHQFLSLEAKEVELEGTPKYQFEIVRNGKKAYNLSEGERSLIAFCYFIARLEDLETAGKKPVIWIDDPVSSLDSNHLFFVYSLIREEIVGKERHEQLFISTHNLTFLKFLLRLRNKTGQWFMVESSGDSSRIIEMPKYLKTYITEFVYLFDQIYQCAQIEEVNDSNFHLVYNFGNHLRKFLELYLYYKFPHISEGQTIENYERFFGLGKMPPFLVDRLTNEYSHLAGTFERGEKPIEEPEIKKVAALVVQKIEEHDSEQYKSLLKCIGVES